MCVSIFEFHICRIQYFHGFCGHWLPDKFIHDLGLDAFGCVFFSGLGGAPSLHNVAYFFVCEPDVELFLRVGQVVSVSLTFFSLGFGFGLLQFSTGRWDGFEAHSDPSGITGFVVTWVLTFAIHTFQSLHHWVIICVM